MFCNGSSDWSKILRENSLQSIDGAAGDPICKQAFSQGYISNTVDLVPLVMDGRTAPRTAAMDTFRRGSGCVCVGGGGGGGGGGRTSL